MSVLFHLLTFAINLWHREFVTADFTAVLVNNQHGIQRRGKDFDKKFVLEGYTAKRLTEEANDEWRLRLRSLHHSKKTSF